MTLYSLVPSPIGDLLVRGDEQRVSGLFSGPAPPEPGWRRADSAFAAVRDQLDAYFAGELRRFEVPLDLEPRPPFHRAVWMALLDVPFGTTITYRDLARRLGRPLAARAVGSANARNPVSIIVPCHRVVGATGALTGYAGGLERKRFLLAHEDAVLAARDHREAGR